MTAKGMEVLGFNNKGKIGLPDYQIWPSAIFISQELQLFDKGKMCHIIWL